MSRFAPLLKSLALIIVLALGCHLGAMKGYHVTYVATPSVPRGWYLIVPLKGELALGELVEFVVPKKIWEFVRELNWVPDNGRLLKYLFARAGDHVCVHEGMLRINGVRVAPVWHSYAPNKPLPQLRICGRLKAGEYLLMSTRRARSFDGRYFGVVSRQNLLGRAIPLIVWE